MRQIKQYMTDSDLTRSVALQKATTVAQRFVSSGHVYICGASNLYILYTFNNNNQDK